MARYGINALYLIPGGVGGTEIYLRNLIAAMAALKTDDEFFLFTNTETGADLVPRDVNWHHCPQNVRAAVRPLRLLWEQTLLPGAARSLRLDAMLNPGFTAPILTACPNVTVFHDLQHLRHPEHFRWWDLPFWRFFLWASVRRSRRLIAVSDATKADLLHFYKLRPDRIDVIPHGVSTDFFDIAAQRRETEPMLLCVSTLHPHKNIERLVAAFAKFAKRHPEYRLVLAGMRGFHATAIEQKIQELGLSGRVEITGWMERAKLLDLFRRARAFVYPSTFEGFGMPVLEAMAAGIPLACSDIEPLHGIANGAAVLFPPHDEHAIAGALERLVTEESCSRVQLGQARAREFTWKRAAEQTLAALQRARS